MVDTVAIRKPPKRQELAAALGVSRQMVHKLEKQGMSTESVDAAVAWREKHLRGHMTKGNRITDVARADAAIARVHRLVPVAIAAIEADRFDLVELEFRSALRAVPRPGRERIEMDVQLWERLVGDVRDKLNELAGTPDPNPEASASDYVDDDDLGSFWYQVAAGERRWADL